MNKRISKQIWSGLVVLGVLLGGTARAQVVLHDGSTNSVATSANAASVSTNFTVTAGASVLVVSLYDRDQAAGLSPTNLSWGAQTLTRGVTQNNLTSHYADSDIFYLFNPTPGTQTITATDTSGTTPSAMTMQVYTLSGVNTNIAPVAYTNGTASFGSSLSLNFSDTTPAGAWAAVNASYGDSGGGGFHITSTGGAAGIDYVVNNQSQLMGGISGLPPGPTTVTEFDSDGGQQTALTALVFTPTTVVTPGAIALQDGSTLPATSTGATSVSANVTVTAGASVLVVSLFDRNSAESGTVDGLPSTIPWLGGQTLTRAVEQNNGNSTWAYDDIYYLYNPTPGTSTITITDSTSTAPSALDLQAYTLNGVNTNVAPVAYSSDNNATTTTSLSVTLTNTTPPGAWAVVNSSYGTGESSGPAVTSSSGLVDCPLIDNSTSQMIGFIANLAGGATTITASVPVADGVQKMALAVAVFQPPVTGPAAPTNLTAKTGQTNAVPLSWSDGSGGVATGYIVLRSATSGANYAPIATNVGNATTNYTDTTAADYTTWYYVVQAVDASGLSLYSAQASATPVNIPVAAPTNLVATAQTNQVVLSWSDASGGRATNYLVLRSTTSGANYVVIATTIGNTSTTYTDHTVYDGTTYYYVVEAYAGIASPNSAQASAAPFFALPSGESGTSSLLDGGTNTVTTVANGAGSNITANFTVSQGAGVMVIELWDRNTESNNSSPSFMSWSNNTTGTVQTAIRAVSENSGASTYSDVDIYYLFNPTPGTGTVSGTDTNSVTIQGLTMMVFDLAGVNTTVKPVVYATNNSSATTLSVTTAATTPGGSWAAVVSYDGNSGNALVNASTSGTSTYTDVANNQEQAMGYITGLKAGSSTISMTDSGGASKASLAAAVFAPAIGTGIFVQDGGITATPYNVGAGVSNVAAPFSVTEGASVLVVEVYDNNNSGPVPPAAIGDEGPALVWSNASLGTIQLLTLCEATNTLNYTWTWADVYYLMDPLPGVGFITGADTATTHNYIQVSAFTLGGVDTTAPVFAAGNGSSSSSAMAVTTSPNQVFGSWAAVISVNYNGGGGNNIIFSNINGGAVEANPHPNGLQVASGYITNLAAGSSTITATATGVPTDMDMSVAVFSPLPGTAAPVNLAASGQTNQILLTWADGSGGLATSYILQRSLDDINFFSIVTNIGNASTSYTDTNVIDWTTYYYQVQAVSSGGVSLFSAQASTNAIGFAAVPKGLTAAAGINSVTLTWNNQIGASSFTILRSTTSGSGFASIGNSATFSFTDTQVTDGTKYYYEISATNSFGASSNSSQVSAVPVVVFFTNWVGIFNSASDAAGWIPFNGAYSNALSPTGVSPDSQFFSDNPGHGPSSGCLILDGLFGPFNSADFQGIATNFLTAQNVSTYQNLELDIKGEAGWDRNDQVQAIQLNLQLPVGPTYQQGTSPSITLYQTLGGGNWTHYVIPVTNWSAYNLTALTAFGINIFDNQYNVTNSDLDVAFDNIEFTGAPGWNSAFSSLTSPTIGTNATNVTLTGTVSGTVAGTNVYLFAGTPITVTINGVAQQTAISDATGDFSINYSTAGLKLGSYPVTYAAASDNVALIGVTNSSTTLTLSAVTPPTSPTILPPSLDATRTNVVIRVATQSGHNYYLLSTTNLASPTTWSTNVITAGTGGTITNVVAISPSHPDVYFKFMVQ